VLPAADAAAGAAYSRAGWWRAWRARFGLAEVCGTLAALGGFAAGYLAAGSLLAAAGLATLCEGIGFYGCVGVKTAAAASRATAHLSGFRRLAAGMWHAVTQQLASCAAAEALDGFLVRPGCLAGAAWLARPLPGGVWLGFAVGKVVADVAWYGMEAAARRGVARSLAVRQPAAPDLRLEETPIADSHHGAARMHRPDRELADSVLSVIQERLASGPGPLRPGSSVTAAARDLEGLIGPRANDPAQVLAAFTELAANQVPAAHERYLAFVPTAPTTAANLGDLLVTVFGLHAISALENPGAVAAENQALAVLAAHAGMPASAGGCFVSGGTMANLSALVAARDSRPLPASMAGRRPRVAVSSEAHSSVAKALHVIGADPFEIPADDHRLTGKALHAALARDREPETVIAVVATAGTTNAGIIDDLADVAAVAAEWGLWFHVDAAYGGAALFAPRARGRFAGIEHADSLVIDPHKWLFAPVDSSALIFRQPELAAAALAQHPAYHEIGAEEFNPSEYALHMTRRARGLPLWFSLAVHGTQAYGEAVESALELARYAARRIDCHPRLQLIREPELSVVLLRRTGWIHRHYAEWARRLLDTGMAFVMPTEWEGQPAARLCFLHPGTPASVVDEVLASLA
jgi:glutamate/tyrosine decarboxylase-like PLP-dependent enzyme